MDLFLDELILEAKKDVERKQRERLNGNVRKDALVGASEEIWVSASKRAAK